MTQDTISDIVAEYNKERERVAGVRVLSGKRNLLYLVPAGAAVVAVIGFFIFNGQGKSATITLILGGLAWVFLAAMLENDSDQPVNRLQNNLRNRLFPALFSDVKNIRFNKQSNRSIETHIPGPLLPRHNQSSAGDIVEGQYKGRHFTIGEYHLEFTSKPGHARVTRTVFKGLAVVYQLSHPLPAKLVVRENRSAVTKWLIENLSDSVLGEHINIDIQDFESHYDLHCIDEQFARKVFDFIGVSLFLEMQGRYATGHFQMQADHTKVSLLIDHPVDFFEMPPIDHSTRQY